MRGTVLTLVLAILLAGCGTGREMADPVDPGDDGPVGARVVVGTALAGGSVPIVEYGEGDDHPARAWRADAATGTVEGLPPFPDEGWLAEASAVATERWTVVAGWLCAEPAVEDDTGLVCRDEGRDVVMALGAGEPAWRVVDTDVEWTTPHPLSLVDDVLTLTVLTPSDGEGDRPVTIDLGAPELTLGPLGELGPDRHTRRCSFGQDPQPTFDTDAGPSTVVLPAPGGGPGQEVPVPEGLGLTGPPWGGVICWSSGRMLMVRDDPVDGPSSAEAWSHRLFDLAEGRQVAELRLGDIVDLAVAGDRVAIVEDREVTVLTVAGDEVGRAEIGFDTEVRATEAGIVVVEWDEGGDGWRRFASVEVLDL